MSPGPQKQFDREDVLEKAMVLFWEHGYEATGLAELLEHVGIGRQSLYDTFGGKRALMIEALAHYFRTRVGPMLAQLRAPGSPLENLRRALQLMEQQASKTGFCGCLVGNTAAEFAFRDQEMAEHLAAYYRVVEDGFYDVLKRAQAAGELSAELSPRDLARTLLNTLQGVALLSKVFRDRGMARSVIRSCLSLLQGV